MDDLISRQTPIEARRYTFGNDEFSLENAYHDCKLVFDGITDDDSFQKADTGLILYYANEIIYALQEALEGKDTNVPTNDCISRQDALNALLSVKKELDAYLDDYIKDFSYALRSLAKAERNRVEEDIEIITGLPSLQPEPIRINLNEPIKVKLTDWGKEIYYHQYDRINQIAGREVCKPSFPKEDENGYAEFQLWCFMELYGECMGITMPNVIEPLEIVYER